MIVPPDGQLVTPRPRPVPVPSVSLPGAAAVGARPIRVTELAAPDSPPVEWDGETLTSLTELPPLLGEPA